MKNPVNHDVTHTTLAVLFIGVLIASSFWILRPFTITEAFCKLGRKVRRVARKEKDRL